MNEVVVYRGAATGAAAGTTRASLVGRAQELDRLGRLLALAAGGDGQVVVIEGEPGIGKTRLLAEALAGASELGFRVFRNRAEELDCRRPFGAIADCLGVVRGSPDPRRADIARRLFGDHSSAAGSGSAVVSSARPDSEYWLIEALVALVEDLCQAGPVALAVDDLQWADGETLLVLHRLSRVASQLPLFLAGTARPSPRPPTLARLVQAMAERGASPMALGPLDAVAVAALLAETVGATPGPRLARQATTAGGNPFFVTELVAALRASGSIEADGEGAEINAVALPPALKLTVLHRMSFLSTETLDVLRMASVLGSSFSVRDLGIALQRSAVALSPCLREAIGAGLLAEAGARIAFRHDLLREALYDDIPLGLRMSLHYDVGRALGEAGAPAVEVAEHFMRGASRGDVVALSWLQRAADEVSVHAPGIAADLLGEAIKLFEPGPARDLVTAEWVVSLELSGRVSEAETICLDLLSRPQEPLTEVRLRLSLSRLYSTMGRHDDALAASARALEVEGLTEAQRLRRLANASNLEVFGPDLNRAEDMAKEALAGAQGLGDPVASAVATWTLSAVALRRGRFLDARAWAVMVPVAGDLQPGERTAQGWQHLRLALDLANGSALLRLDRLGEAETILTQVRQATERLSYRRLLIATQRLLVVRRFLAGDWDDAVAEYDAVVDLCEELNDRSGAMEESSGIRALIAVHQGDLRGAAALVPEQEPAREPDVGCWSVRARALLAEATGAPDVAFDELWTAWQRCLESGSHAAFAALGPAIVSSIMHWLDFGLAGSASGGSPTAGALDRADLERARAVAEAVEVLAEANPEVASQQGAALRCRGLVHADASLLLAASAAYRNAGWRFESALACEDAADLLGRAGRMDESRPLFNDVAARYLQMDAAWDAARVASRMRAIGMRRGNRGSRQRAKVGWDALTANERAVVVLVAEGLTNPDIADRLFVSRHTVKAQVSSALAKLQLTSRIELARVAMQQGMGTEATPTAVAAGPVAGAPREDEGGGGGSGGVARRGTADRRAPSP